MRRYMNRIKVEDIPFGEDNAISRKELAHLWDTSDRGVRQAIEDFRQNNILICSYSSNAGYFRPQKREEVEHYIRDMRKRISTLTTTIVRTEHALRDFDHKQPKLF